jgi:RsmE family RNA methyltransferase
MNIVLFTADEIASPLLLSDERAKHITGVLTKRTGDSFEAGIINGKAGTALITKIADGAIQFSFEAKTDGKPLYPLKMLVAFPRPIQLKRLFRDMAGLGAAEIHLCGSDLGEKSYMQSKLVERGTARQMLLDGSAQAKSTHIPELFLHETLDSCLNSVVSSNKHTLLVAPDNVKPACPLRTLLAETVFGDGAEVVAAIGGERGWTERERVLLTNAGFVLCGLGERILRTETAATVAASLILARMELI